LNPGKHAQMKSTWHSHMAHPHGTPTRHTHMACPHMHASLHSILDVTLNPWANACSCFSQHGQNRTFTYPCIHALEVSILDVCGKEVCLEQKSVGSNPN
jgi:hypothetical protein